MEKIFQKYDLFYVSQLHQKKKVTNKLVWWFSTHWKKQAPHRKKNNLLMIVVIEIQKWCVKCQNLNKKKAKNIHMVCLCFSTHRKSQKKKKKKSCGMEYSSHKKANQKIWCDVLIVVYPDPYWKTPKKWCYSWKTKKIWWWCFGKEKKKKWWWSFEKNSKKHWWFYVSHPVVNVCTLPSGVVCLPSCHCECVSSPPSGVGVCFPCECECVSSVDVRCWYVISIVHQSSSVCWVVGHLVCSSLSHLIVLPAQMISSVLFVFLSLCSSSHCLEWVFCYHSLL